MLSFFCCILLVCAGGRLPALHLSFAEGTARKPWGGEEVNDTFSRYEEKLWRGRMTVLPL